MDALILSCGTGGGHNTAARAIKEEMEKRGFRTVMLNPYTLRSDKLADRIDNSYIEVVKKAPVVFGTVYKAGELYSRLPFHSPVYFVNGSMISAMEDYLRQHSFDVVITTHLYPAEILTNMKRRGMKLPKTIYVATDYVCIPFTEETECDAYVIPAEDLTDAFAGKGIPREKIFPLGIPVHSRFSPKISRSEARSRLGITPEGPILLVAGGSMGGGRIDRMINELDCESFRSRKIEQIIICGSNRVLYEKLCRHKIPHRKVIGYTDQMELYLNAADLFLTKPGGLSSTEAAVCGIPMLHMSAIPGCETSNVKYFSDRGMSIACHSAKDVIGSSFCMLGDNNLRQEMIRNQKKHVNGNAASQICDLAEKIGCQE